MKETQLNQETIFDWETQVTEDILSFMRKQMEHAYALGKTPRDFHSKGHSWVRAEFRVEANIDKRFRHGLFKEPKTYQAWIRYSNASNGIRKDSARDVRGMAIKLFDVPGKKLVTEGDDHSTLDLLTFSAPKFLTRDSKQFLSFVRAILGSSKVAAFLFGLLNPGVIGSVLTSFKKTKSLLNIDYFSATPYALGNNLAVKYVVTQKNQERTRIPRDPSQDFLLQNLQDYLDHKDATFDFNVQPQVNPQTEPIENGLKVWKSPYYKVATLYIPRQRVTTQNLVDLAENSAYNPWRTLEEHRPLGNINRVRKEIYKHVSEFRHMRNYTQIANPDPDSVPDDGAKTPKVV